MFGWPRWHLFTGARGRRRARGPYDICCGDQGVMNRQARNYWEFIPIRAGKSHQCQRFDLCQQEHGKYHSRVVSTRSATHNAAVNITSIRERGTLAVALNTYGSLAANFVIQVCREWGMTTWLELVLFTRGTMLRGFWPQQAVNSGLICYCYWLAQLVSTDHSVRSYWAAWCSFHSLEGHGV